MFLRKSTTRRDPLPVTMSGVRMGERVLQVGAGDPRIVGAIAAKVGLSGHAAMAVADEPGAARARAAAAEAGGLADVHVTPADALPFPDGDFDALVVHNMDQTLAGSDAAQHRATAAEWRRVLRAGGRIVVIERGTPSGLGALLRTAPKADPAYEAGGGTVAVLENGGFRPVRTLGDREGFRFVEGLKT